MKQITKEQFNEALARAIDVCMNKAHAHGAGETGMTILMVGTLVGLELKEKLFDKDDEIEIVDREG